MKTAEQILREEQSRYNKKNDCSENDFTDKEWEEVLKDEAMQPIIKAMQLYAEAYFEANKNKHAMECLKKASENADTYDANAGKGFGLLPPCLFVNKQSIHNENNLV